MRLNEIIDKCGLRLLIFIAAYLLLRHCYLSTFNHMLSAVTITLCTVALLEALLYGRKAARPSKEAIRRTVAALALRGNEAFIFRLSEAACGKLTDSGNGFVTLKKCYVSAELCSPVSPAKVAECFRQAVTGGCKKVAVFAPMGADNGARELIHESPVKIKLIGAEKLYATLQSMDMLPKLAGKKKKKTFRELMKLLFARENGRKFLFAAAVIFIFSFLVSFTVWYIVVAVINIAVAAVCISGVADKRL